MDADRDALARYLNGDESGFEELVVRHEASVRNLALSFVRDRGLAEDIAQETFLLAYRKAGSFRGDGSVRSWIFRIAVRRSLDALRRRGRRREEALEGAAEPASTPHGAIDSGWDVEQALATLQPDHRAALLMKEVDGLSYREIAEAMGWPVGTVATRLHRARLALRAALARDVGAREQEA